MIQVFFSMVMVGSGMVVPGTAMLATKRQDLAEPDLRLFEAEMTAVLGSTVTSIQVYDYKEAVDAADPRSAH